MQQARSVRRAMALSVCLALALVACGSSGGSDDAADVSTTVSVPGDVSTTLGSASPAGDPHGKVRVVNMFLRDGKPFGPLDIYDVYNPGKDTKPVIKGLAYGAISDYVSPRAISDSGQLYLYPAGSLTRQDQGIGGQALSNSGWRDTDQATVVIGSTKGLTPTDPNTPMYTEITESDPNAMWHAIAGKGAILVNVSGVGVDSNAASVTLVVDGTCPMRVDPENSPGGGSGLDTLANGNAVTYAVDPGSHAIGLLATDPTTAVTTCNAAAAQAKASVDLAAGGRVEVFVSGTSPTNLKVLIAPVDAP